MHDEVAGDAAAEEELVGEDVVGGGGGVVGNDEAGANEDFAEEAAEDVNEVEDAGEAGVELGRRVEGAMSHGEMRVPQETTASAP